MINEAGIAQALADGLDPMGFRGVRLDGEKYAGCHLLLKRQTWNTNRAIAFVSVPAVPDDFGAFLKSWRSKLTWKVGFFPVFYSLGMQIIVSCPGIRSAGIDLDKHVAKIDNQWSIVQSIFLIEPDNIGVVHHRTWGQLVTGKFQDKILTVLRQCIPDE